MLEYESELTVTIAGLFANADVVREVVTAMLIRLKCSLKSFTFFKLLTLLRPS